MFKRCDLRLTVSVMITFCLSVLQSLTAQAILRLRSEGFWLQSTESLDLACIKFLFVCVQLEVYFSFPE